MNRYLLRLFKNIRLHENLRPPAHHKWLHSSEKSLLAWSIKARNYNMTTANILCLTIGLSTFLSYYFLWPSEENSESTIASIAIISIILYAVIISIHEKTNFAFRFSNFGLELCEWKELSKATLIFIRAFTIVAATILLIMFSLSPELFLVSLVGIGGIGIIYLAALNSQAFRDRHTTYHLEEFPWKNFKEIHVDRRKKLISLEVTCFDPDIQEYSDWPVYLFAPKKDFERNLAFVKEQLPNLPVREMRISVLN